MAMVRPLFGLALCLFMAMSAVSCADQEETNIEQGHVPVQSGISTSVTENKDIKDTDNPQDNELPHKEECDCDVETDNPILATYPRPSGLIPTIGPSTPLPLPDVTLRPTPGFIPISERYSHAGLGVSFGLPDGYQFQEGTARSARFTAGNKTIEFTLLVRLGTTSGGVHNNIRVGFTQMKDLLFYNSGNTKCRAWDMGVHSTMTDLRFGQIKATRDVLYLEMIDPERYEIIFPHALATYFDLGASSYILAVIGEPEDAKTMETLSDSIMTTIQAHEAKIDLASLALETISDTRHGISFKLPTGWVKSTSPGRIVYRPDATMSDPLYHVQVACFTPSTTFNTSYEAPAQIPQQIGHSYLKNPAQRPASLRTDVRVIGYEDIRLDAAGIYINRYLIQTKVAGLTGENLKYIQDEGLVESYLYTLETRDGHAYAINISSADANKSLRNEIADLISRTLVID